jgi:hypothetical protein
MTPITSLDRIEIPAVESAPKQPRLFVVEAPQSAPQRSATEMWLLAFALLSAITFAGAIAKFALAPAISTVTASSATTPSFDGP